MSSKDEKIKIELDYEMNTMVYEIEFDYNGKDFDYAVDATNGSILNLHQNESKENSSNTTQDSNQNYISKDKAKEIALNYANVDESQITNYWIELEKDDDQIIYEIDFNVNRIEYSFEIGAMTGIVIEFEKDDD